MFSIYAGLKLWAIGAKIGTMKYDSLLTEVKNRLPSAQNILIALPTTAGVDEFAAGLALFLSLQEAGKNASIATDGIVRVGHSNLFGVGQIQNKLPDTIGGNLIVTLGGVVSQDASGKSIVPALEELNWHPQGTDLELVFKVAKGQKFEPTHITPRYQGDGFDLIVTIGTSALDALGTIYQGNQEAFIQAFIINLDKNSNNSQYASLNIIDPAAVSLSEMVALILPDLGLPYSADTATNVVNGIYAATNNLQGNVGADTFESIALALRAGAQKPVVNVSADTQTATPQPTATTLEQVFSLQGGALGGFNQSAQTPATPIDQLQSTPATNQPTPTKDSPTESSTPDTQPQPSPEEVPAGEEAVTPEADWLTPKIYKSSQVG